MLTDGRTDGRMVGGRKVITIAHPEQSSGELKISGDILKWETIHMKCKTLLTGKIKISLISYLLNMPQTCEMLTYPLML